ncbi:unnamed protein product [Tuber aestivum]|uniref:CLASP N-terminal domain-containing protein n=1 Tax=Tuber aestivum TaxID=59557 RepID=A0A292PJN0_9PEZI|nr:unnamed protein product [Tuber aestivum]
MALLKEEPLVVGLGRVAALQLIGKVAEKVVMRDGFLKEVMGRELEALVPVVEGGMHHLKNEVSRAAVKAMASLSKLLRKQ